MIARCPFRRAASERQPQSLEALVDSKTCTQLALDPMRMVFVYMHVHWHPHQDTLTMR